MICQILVLKNCDLVIIIVHTIDVILQIGSPSTCTGLTISGPKQLL